MWLPPRNHVTENRSDATSDIVAARHSATASMDGSSRRVLSDNQIAGLVAAAVAHKAATRQTARPSNSHRSSVAARTQVAAPQSGSLVEPSGHGVLHRVTEGSMKLYDLDRHHEIRGMYAPDLAYSQRATVEPSMADAACISLLEERTPRAQPARDASDAGSFDRPGASMAFEHTLDDAFEDVYRDFVRGVASLGRGSEGVGKQVAAAMMKQVSCLCALPASHALIVAAAVFRSVVQDCG